MTADYPQVRGVEDLVRDLELAGISEGDSLILHSSFRSLGAVAGGPQAVVEAVLDVLGPKGHLMVPTFTYSLPIWNIAPFDYRHSKSRVGAITEVVRQRPDAQRSFHPTHSVAVIGPEADQIVSNHLHATPTGLKSPFGKMYARKAKILMLGTRQDTDTSLHYCEVVAQMPYLDVVFTQGQDFEIAWFYNEADQIEYTRIHELPGCSRGFEVIEPELRRRGVLKDVRIGEAASQLLEMESFVPAAVEVIREQPSLLLCMTPGCTICQKRRAFMKSLG